MFKKLKDKIAEEVKQSPARFQEIINSAQVSWIFNNKGVDKKQIELVS